MRMDKHKQHRDIPGLDSVHSGLSALEMLSKSFSIFLRAQQLSSLCKDGHCLAGCHEV